MWNEISDSIIYHLALTYLTAMHSHHSHSGQFCRHAKDDLEAVVKKAIEVGFTTFGLSEHAPRYRPEDLFPEEVWHARSSW
jgi:HisJ family histidinol phosphate phosphatase